MKMISLVNRISHMKRIFHMEMILHMKRISQKTGTSYMKEKDLTHEEEPHKKT